ncbi:MAG: hypothetical protein Q9190_006194 [Brigantiaea leucoxantha]
MPVRPYVWSTFDSESPYPCCFGPIIDDTLTEPRVLQSVLGGDALRWIIDENLTEKVKKLLVERIVLGDYVLKTRLAGDACLCNSSGVAKELVQVVHIPRDVSSL